MELGKYFITNKPREIAGGRTSDKFTYQQEWALNKILELFEEDKDFALIMEYHEDVVIFDSSIDPKHIDMFQIKTNENKKDNFITPAILMKQEKDKNHVPPKLSHSFLEKLFYNFSLFDNYEKNIYFVSNKPFKFGLSKLDSEIKNPIFLADLKVDDFKNLKVQICKVCNKIDCTEECKNCVAFEKSSMNVQTAYEQLFTKLQVLVSGYANITYADAKAIYNTLMAQIKTINDSSEKLNCTDFDILIQKYSISKKNLKKFLAKISFDQSFSNKWPEINATLLSEGYNVSGIKKIKSTCQDYVLETFKDFEGSLYALTDLIDQELKSTEFETIKEMVEAILFKIKSSSTYESLLYQDDFYEGAIIMRWFSE